MNENKIIISILVLLGVASCLFIILKNKHPVKINSYANANITIRTFQTNTIGEWGYDILIDGNMYIHQPNIPAFSGDYGFKTKQDAQKVAEFVVDKIRNNEIPPSVTTEELRTLEVII